MDEKKFKQRYKPASCTNPPWASLIPSERREEILGQIRRETIAAYGYSMDECTKRKVCFTKTCMGRPLPFESKTAEPYLKQLTTTHRIMGNELYLSNCDSCQLAKTCRAACAQVNDFINRDKSEEPNLVYKENLDNFVQEEIHTNPMDAILSKGLKIPWDCLTQKRQDTVKKYLYEQKDFLTIAQELKFHDQSRARYEFYAAMTSLSKYAVIRDFIEKNVNSNIMPTGRNWAILNEVYFLNRTLEEVANTHRITKQFVQQILTKFVKTHNLKWHVFVRKEGNKIIYQVPKLFK